MIWRITPSWLLSRAKKLLLLLRGNTQHHTQKKVIYVSDRATLFNLLIGLNGYTICSGILNRNLNGDSIMAVPLETEDNMLIGWIADPRIHLSQFARKYLEELNRLIGRQP